MNTKRRLIINSVMLGIATILFLTCIFFAGYTAAENDNNKLNEVTYETNLY